MARVLLFSQVIGKLAGIALWLHRPGSLAGTGFFFIPDIFVLYHLFVPSGQWLCAGATSFETDRREVWLTIDDGPDREDTPKILDLLDRHEARATFFVVGERVARWPALVPEIIRRGHEVAHHTHTHPAASFWCAGPDRVKRELDDGLAVLRTASVRPQRFRPPVGIKNLFLGRALTARRLRCVGWTIRSGDCLGRRTEHVVANVMKRVRPGAILLFHEGRSVPTNLRVDALAQTLAALQSEGYRCVIPRPEQLCPKTTEDVRNAERLELTGAELSR
jgi:peptidoglycan/xylan/chitin deacetylase (PgdA/CDA1 family)